MRLLSRRTSLCTLTCQVRPAATALTLLNHSPLSLVDHGPYLVLLLSAHQHRVRSQHDSFYRDSKLRRFQVALSSAACKVVLTCAQLLVKLHTCCAWKRRQRCSPNKVAILLLARLCSHVLWQDRPLMCCWSELQRPHVRAQALVDTLQLPCRVDTVNVADAQERPVQCHNATQMLRAHCWRAHVVITTYAATA